MFDKNELIKNLPQKLCLCAAVLYLSLSLNSGCTFGLLSLSVPDWLAPKFMLRPWLAFTKCSAQNSRMSSDLRLHSFYYYTFSSTPGQTAHWKIFPWVIPLNYLLQMLAVSELTPDSVPVALPDSVQSFVPVVLQNSESLLSVVPQHSVVPSVRPPVPAPAAEPVLLLSLIHI